MGRGTILQSSFLGGQWSKYAQGRVDLPDYKNAMAKCFNGFPIEEGAWARRGGTMNAGTTWGGIAGRPIPFSFSGSAPFTVEFGNSRARFRLGADLVVETNPQVVSSISNATPAVLTVTGTPTWATGDHVILDPLNATTQTALANYVNRELQVTKTGASTFTLSDPVTGLAIPGAAVGWAGGLSATVAKVQTVALPYANGDWAQVRFTQIELMVVLWHPNYAPYQITAAPYPASLQTNNWSPTVGNVVFSSGTFLMADGPYLNPTAVGGLTCNSLGTGNTTITASGSTLPNNGLGFQTSDVGRMIRMLNIPPYWFSGGFYNIGDVYTDKTNQTVYQCIQAITAGGTGSTIAPSLAPLYWQIATTGFTWTWGTIGQYLSSTQVVVNIQGPGLLYDNVTPSQGGAIVGSPLMQFAMGVFSATTGYPACGCYHEGRLWTGGAVPNRFDASYANGLLQGGALSGYWSFAPTDDPNLVSVFQGQVTDANGISYVLNATGANQIFWMQPTLQGIVCGTASGEFLIQASNQNNVLTPTSIQAHRSTHYRCENIAPADTGLTTVFVQRFGRRLIEYLSDVFSGKFFGPNLAERALDITAPGIKEITYQETLVPTLWSRLADGSLSGTTYRRVSSFSSEPPKFMGWHTHQLGSGRKVMGLSSGPSPDANGETITMSTLDPLTGIYHVEVMHNYFQETDPLWSAWHLDNAGPPAALVTVNSGAALQALGLWWLEGEQVSAFIAGLDCGSYRVSGGAITIPYQSDPDKLFTRAYLAALSTSGQNFGVVATPVDNGQLTVPALVGFSFTSQGQVLRPLEPLPAANGPLLAKTRRTNQFGLLAAAVNGTATLGTDLTKTMYPLQVNQPNGSPYTRDILFKGVLWGGIEGGYDFDGGIGWSISGPYPLTISALQAFVQEQDR